MSNAGPGDYDHRITSGAVGVSGSYLMSVACDVAIKDTNLILSGQPRIPDAALSTSVWRPFQTTRRQRRKNSLVRQLSLR